MRKITWSRISWLIVILVIGVMSYFKITNRPASPELHEKIKGIVTRHPELQVVYDVAMSDGVLSLSEARQMTKAAKTLRDAEEAIK